MNVKIAVTTTAGTASGRNTRNTAPVRLKPSSHADSSRSRGTVWKYDDSIHTANAMLNAA